MRRGEKDESHQKAKLHEKGNAITLCIPCIYKPDAKTLLPEVL